MKTIVGGKPHVVKLLGKQRLKDTEYRLMNYVLKTQCDDGVLIHNAITGKLVLLSTEEANFLNSLPYARIEAMTELIEDYFLVPIAFDEKETVQKLRSLIKRLEPTKGIESYTILTTTNCNARCFYCYESDLPHINMDEATADRLVEYMIEHRGNKTLKLHWFGGEPLVCLNRIDQICEGLKEKGIKYVSSMTSNGYLFNEEIAEKAVTSWKLDSVQITLDGTEDIYNKTKAYVNVQGSPYKRVLENIQLLLDKGVRVIIRLNLDKHNADDLGRLVSELNGKIKRKNRIEVYSHVLFEDAGFDPIRRDEEGRELLYNRQIELNTELEKLGLGKNHKALPFLKTHNCMADTDSAAAVYPDGKLFKCEHIYIGDEYGTIDTDIINHEGIEKFQLMTERDECASCPIYPSCILLRNCQGVMDKNQYTCKYEVELSTKSLITHYNHSKDKKQ